MTKAPLEQFLEIANVNGGLLTTDSAIKLEELLNTLMRGERTSWLPAAHFLLGCHYSEFFWEGGFPDKTSCRSHAEANAQSAIDHFTAFLHSSVRPCPALSVDDKEVETPDVDERMWALFGVVTESTETIPLKSDGGDLDLIGVALDRVALAHYLLGENKLSADTLEAGLLSPSRHGWRSSIDLTRLHGWIGWLYFEAEQYVKAADHLQQCWDGVQWHSKHTNPLTGTGCLMLLLDWHRWFGINQCDSKCHAISEISDGEDLIPTGTLDCGCDALLLRLAISQAVAGEYEKAMDAVHVCIQLGEHVDEQEASLQGWSFEDEDPVPFPEARLFRAALALKLSHEDSVVEDLIVCRKQADRLSNEVHALVCLHLRRDGNRSEVEGTVFSEVVSQIISASTEQRSEMERLGGLVLDELLDGSLVKSGFRSENALCFEERLRQAHKSARGIGAWEE